MNRFFARRLGAPAGGWRMQGREGVVVRDALTRLPAVAKAA